MAVEPKKEYALNILLRELAPAVESEGLLLVREPDDGHLNGPHEIDKLVKVCLRRLRLALLSCLYHPRFLFVICR